MQVFLKPTDNFKKIKRGFLYVLLICLSKLVAEVLFGFLILMFFTLERQISMKNTGHLLLEGLLIGIGCTLVEYWYIRLYRLFAPTFIHALLAFGINFILGVDIAVSNILLLLPQGGIESTRTLILYVMICALSGGLLIALSSKILSAKKSFRVLFLINFVAWFFCAFIDILIMKATCCVPLVR